MHNFSFLHFINGISCNHIMDFTFDKAIIDAAASFASGQVYVALSRCRTLEGMVLATPLRQHSVITDLRVEDYIEIQERAAAESLSRLEEIKKEYYCQLISDMFDFSNLAYLQKRMLAVCGEFPSGSVVGLAQKHNDILNALSDRVVAVGQKWRRIISSKQYEELVTDEFQERVRNGCKYFLKELEDAYGDFLDKMKDLKAGMELSGTVRNVIDFGVFVDIGVHQDGLVHISQVANRRLRHPSDAVKVGDVVEVMVLEVDEKRKRISLSMKQAVEK